MEIKLKKYDAYKNSGVEWLGEIPEGWEVKKLKHVLKFTTGGTPSSQVNGLYDGEEPWVTISDMDGRYIDKTHFISKKGVKAASIPITPKGSLLYSFKLSVGQMAFTKNDIFTNEAIASFHPSKNVNLNYWYYHHPLFLVKNANTNIYGAFLLNQDLIKNAIVLYPPLTEQTAIAKFLDDKTAKIDQAISIKQKQIGLLKERRQILIHKAVTQGINPNVKLKDSGVAWIGEIPEHWEVKRFRNTFKISKGLTITKENLIEEGIPCVNYGEIHSKFGFEVNPKIHSLKCVSEDYLKDNSGSLLKGGDFVFADTSEDIAGSGNFTYLNSKEQVFAGYHTVIARPNRDVNSRFFAYEFDSTLFRNQVRKKVKGVKVYSITQSLLKELSLWLPPFEEQIQIASYLDNQTTKLFTAISLKEKEIEKLKEYKASLINSVVTGKVRVL